MLIAEGGSEMSNPIPSILSNPVPLIPLVTVLKRLVMCFIFKNQALRGYQIWAHLSNTWVPVGDHLGTTWGPLGDHLGTTWGPHGERVGTTWGSLETWGPHGIQVGLLHIFMDLPPTHLPEIIDAEKKLSCAVFRHNLYPILGDFFIFTSPEMVFHCPPSPLIILSEWGPSLLCAHLVTPV